MEYTVEFYGQLKIEAPSEYEAQVWVQENSGRIEFAGKPVKLVNAYSIQVCRFCGCSDTEACELVPGIFCAWQPDEVNVCTNPDCLVRLAAEKALAIEKAS